MKRGLLFAVVLLAAGIARAGDTSAGLVLLESWNSRAPGMGEAGTALSGGAADAFYNPAAAAGFKRNELLAKFYTGLGDVHTGVLGFGRGTKRGGWVVAATLLDAGRITLNTGGV